MGAAGLGYPARRPALPQLAHIRAVLAARLWLQASPAWTRATPGGTPGGASAPSARRASARHLPAAEIHWPSLPASPYAGQVWAVEVELTPKPLARTARIISALQGPARYAQVDLPDYPGRPAGGGHGCGCPSRPRRPGGDPGPAAVRHHPAGLITVMSGRDRPAAGRLPRRAVKAAGWLLLAALAVAAGPVTIVVIAGYVVARLAAGPAAPRRPWPPDGTTRRLVAREAGSKPLLRPGESQAEVMAGMRYRCFLAAVPRRPGIGVLTGEAAEHVQVLVQRDQVIVHQPSPGPVAGVSLAARLRTVIIGGAGSAHVGARLALMAAGEPRRAGCWRWN